MANCKVQAVHKTRAAHETPAARRPLAQPRAGGRVAAVVLAAGVASRMGVLKQLLPIDGEPMVRRVVRTCLDAGLEPVWVVTGHGAREVELALAGMPAVRCVYNPRYMEGQAGSLRAGVQAVADQVSAGPPLEEVAALAVLLGDQPFVRPDTLRRLAALALEPGVLAAAAAYGPALPGPPCVLRRALWPEVLSLSGDRGARSVLLAAGDLVRLVPVDRGELKDIDEPADLKPAGIRPPEPR